MKMLPVANAVTKLAFEIRSAWAKVIGVKEATIQGKIQNVSNKHSTK